MKEEIKVLIENDIKKLINKELEQIKSMEQDIEAFKFVIEKQTEVFRMYKEKNTHIQKLMEKDTSISKYFRVEKYHNSKIQKRIMKTNHKLYNKYGFNHNFHDLSIYNPIISIRTKNGFKYSYCHQTVFDENHIFISGRNWELRIDNTEDLLGKMDLEW